MPELTDDQIRMNWANRPGDDLVIRMCLAGQGRWSQLNRALRDAGHSDDLPNSGWPSNAQIKRLCDEGRIKRLWHGQYVACCPDCGAPIANVFGMEH